MPKASDLLNDGNLLRILSYGASQTYKTFWAAKAAEAGFNVIFINGESNYQVIRNLKPEAIDRISMLNVQDTERENTLAIFCAHFFKGERFLWDETAKRRIMHAGSYVPEHSYVFIDPKKFTSSDLLVLDSWTSLLRSTLLRYSIEKKIDLAQVEIGDKWGYFNYSQNFLNWLLAKFQTVSCHFNLIAHSDHYTKLHDELDSKGNKVSVMEFQRMQIKSTTGPHAMQIPGQFQECYYFFRIGQVAKISTKSVDDRDGGSRVLPPDDYDFPKLQFRDTCKAMGIPVPPEDRPCKAVTFFQPHDPGVQDVMAELGMVKPPNGTDPSGGGAVINGTQKSTSTLATLFQTKRN